MTSPAVRLPPADQAVAAGHGHAGQRGDAPGGGWVLGDSCHRVKRSDRSGGSSGDCGERRGEGRWEQRGTAGPHGWGGSGDVAGRPHGAVPVGCMDAPRILTSTERCSKRQQAAQPRFSNARGRALWPACQSNAPTLHQQHNAPYYYFAMILLCNAPRRPGRRLLRGVHWFACGRGQEPHHGYVLTRAWVAVGAGGRTGWRRAVPRHPCCRQHPSACFSLHNATLRAPA